MTDTPKFNEGRSYGTVIGHPGIRYQQDGHLFNGRKEYVSPIEALASERVSAIEKQEIKEAKREALKEAFKEQLALGGAVTVVTNDVASKTPTIDEYGQGDNIDLNDLHWTKLRSMIEAIGGTYVSKTQAVDYLRSHRGLVEVVSNSDALLPEDDEG
jgi:hypothetical protein